MSTPAAGQRRGQRIAMTPEEVDAFLAEERTCRVATVGPQGPHATPLWFAWDGSALWLYSLSKSQRWFDLEHDNRIAAVIDAGHGYAELRGVEIRGRAEIIGEVPRTGEPNDELTKPESLFAQKYNGTPQLAYDGRHAWRKIVPDKISSWDFRKIGR